jgi:photosystem II stability/assembly factor-like uncharacterized protein
MKKFLSLFVLLSFFAQAQKKQTTSTLAPTPTVDFEKQFAAMKYRNIGPTRGGRSTAVAGIASQPNVFFTGTTGGGVWKTDDGGNSWNNITDGQIAVGSIGSIRVAPSDPNVIYAGTGSADPRGNVSIGKGIYKSSDAGKTWTLMGLEKGGQIGRIEIHPQNPDVVFAAVLGNPFTYNPERGVYRSKDGGKTWERLLFVNDKTGAMDLVMDPNNPRILYAGMWQVQRKPWTLVDGGPDGGVYQSKDGGDTWKKLEAGLPAGVWGKVGIAVSPANSDRVWVLVETPDDAKGGLFRSDDGAKSFTRINGDRELRTRHWYYTHVFADPKDPETVYVNNVNFWKSNDGGKTFANIRVPHGDCHDLWINPINTNTMIHSNDGGAQVTYNGGKTWSTPFNIPTSEIYRVEVDGAFPYRVYGCQQDNSSISVSSALRGGYGRSGIDWLTWGGEAGHVAVDPKTGVIFSGEYSGILFRFDPKTGHNRQVQDYPQLHDGLPLHKVKYRFQWNAPITISPHNSDVLYHCSQYVHKTTDGGQTWQVISPDLTLNKKEYQELPGGPVQIDYTGVENYNTIFVMEESATTQNELWVGTDDGLVHLSTDGGKSWSNITPKGIPALATVNSIDISRHKKGKAYVTAHNYRLGDFKPYVFKTEDYGKTWTSITTGIPADWFTRVVREDPNKEGLLYCGTEFGMFLSVDDGKTWSPFQLNLPRVPITDVMIKDKDLVISTQGRSFWILDDLSPLEQFNPNATSENVTLVTPRTAYRSQLTNNGADFWFYLKEKPDSIKVFWLEILESQGKVLRTFSTDPSKKESKLDVKQGLNHFSWNLQLDAPKIAKGTVFGYGPPDGVPVPPGQYTVRATIGKLGEKSYETNFTVTKDPRWNVTDDDLKAQYDLCLKASDEMNRMHLTIRKIRSMRIQANELLDHAGDGKKSALTPLSKSLNEKLTALENQLTQTKSKAGQDPINYPPMFDEQWNWFLQLLNGQDARPNSGAYALYADLKKQADDYATQFDAIVKNQMKTFNDMLVELKVTGVQIEAVDR